MRSCPLFVVFLCLVWAPAALAAIRQVSPDGSGPYPDIQAAINAALDGDEVELIDGTFTGPGNRGLNFLGKAITVRSQSGNPATCVIDCQGLSEALFCYSGEGPESVLSGVTLANGSSSSGGGAVYLSNASPTFNNCVFSGNHAPLGGAIYT